jgi:hypothetical protein
LFWENVFPLLIPQEPGNGTSREKTSSKLGSSISSSGGTDIAFFRNADNTRDIVEDLFENELYAQHIDFPDETERKKVSGLLAALGLAPGRPFLYHACLSGSV